MRFKINLASLIVGSKFTIFAWFYFVFEGTLQVQAPGGGGGVYLEGRFNGGFFALLVWGVYIWRGLYMEELIFGILRYAFMVGAGGGDKKVECPILPKAQTQKYPYWMEPHFRLLWEVPPWD